jgi:hypothetical protein
MKADQERQFGGLSELMLTIDHLLFRARHQGLILARFSWLAL